ncbi:amino acid adenylation domain-containing protein [Kitasatospora sp. NPDC101183]|uniref:non-ribosomal peptide synthetase family protein n=1 Tax=Kitasatospora sp. NPDC101183 TaxID=3364100 RepID=UPI003816776A
MHTTTAVTALPHARRAPAGSALTDLLDGQVRVRPASPAVIGEDGELTFLDLSERARRTAARLRALGAGPDGCVGLFAEPSTALVAGVWGVLYAGAGYLPLSPEYPEDRLRYMLEDSGTRIVLTQEHLRERLAALVPPGTEVVTVEEAQHRPERVEGEGPGPGDAAYVIYTSGSTGRPKGVLVEHRAVVAQLRWLLGAGHLDPEVTVLQKTPMSFDAAQWEILAPAVGARVVAGTPGLHRDPQALVAAVRRYGVTALQCVPTLLRALLETEGFAGCTGLTGLFSGGEALSRRLAHELAEALPGASLVNLYGPTECTINATAHLVDPAAPGDGADSVPIGRPVDNTQCYVLDEHLAPVGLGGTGELYIGGVQLARGYLNRPELTAERFVPSPFAPAERLYRTGDLARWNPDGTLQFAGRADNQVKLRGHRVELDEIARAVEEHTWVRRSAAVVTEDERTGRQDLVACVELNPREAALMDQDSHSGGHHQSKASRLQVRAQLSDPGVRDPAALAGRERIALPGRRGTEAQRRAVFARKTYRFYDGGPVTREDLLALLAPRPASTFARGPELLSFPELGRVLRWLGQFHSEERLLPKYAYASPGALYAVQTYLETGGLDGLAAGLYYYHPVEHALIRVGAAEPREQAYLTLHFSGRTGAIEPVYKNNIREVMEFETGHLLGVLEEVLPEYGLTVRPLGADPAAGARLDVAEEDEYLGAFEVGRAGERSAVPVELYVQAHEGRVEGLPAGLYRYGEGELARVSDEVVEARHVIAINQSVYARAAFGITAVARAGAGQEWLEYIALGTELHRLQRNGLGLGFMSSGYSSKSGHPLPASRRIDAVLEAAGLAGGPSYFFLGGRVSEEQIRSEGMREDAVHMKGPAEIVKDELATLLPDYMLPNRVLVLDELPLTANGKVDLKALAASEAVRTAGTRGEFVAPATGRERWLAGVWGEALGYEEVSVADEFFAVGGNSLIAVALVHRINRECGVTLPLQVLFECPRLGDLAARIDRAGPADSSSRFVPLAQGDARRPVFCWPGLGGYPMNLRTLGREAGDGRAFYGIQSHGINAGETPYATIREMAATDLAELRRIQPEGPYTLWGYSFGARVAFEAAWQLEQAGERVENLLLICPGNPEVRRRDGKRWGREASYANPAYLTILYSVFAGAISGPDLERCLAEAGDEDGFTAFVHRLLPELDEELIRRIARIVGETYEFEYSFGELAERRLDAPVTVLKAAGDDYSFIEGRTGWSAAPPAVVDLAGDHYGVLREPGVLELAAAIRAVERAAGE